MFLSHFSTWMQEEQLDAKELRGRSHHMSDGKRIVREVSDKALKRYWFVKEYIGF